METPSGSRPNSLQLKQLEVLSNSSISNNKSRLGSSQSSRLVYSWGHALYGQLGVGSNSNERTPKIVTSLTSTQITTVCAGEYHSAALTGKDNQFIPLLQVYYN
jgi:alpha-tubulin suppressor-like RCC1 family protein